MAGWLCGNPAFLYANEVMAVNKFRTFSNNAILYAYMRLTCSETAV